MSKSVDRVLDFFEVFTVEKRPLSLSELARVLDVPVSTCHGVLKALVARGYLYELKARGGFYPTARLADIGALIVEADPVLSRVEPILAALRDEIGESVFLAKANGLEITYLATLHADTRLRLTLAPGDHVRSLYASSAGKAVLATLPPRALAALLERLPLVPLTAATITSKAALRRDLKTSEGRGWFVNREETVEDSMTISGRFTMNGTLYVVTIAGSLKPMERNLPRAAERLLATLATLNAVAP